MSRRKAFTLVELLIVILLIGLLIGLLLPVLNKARRRALVLACPIAYLGRDGRIHLTDPSGKLDLEFQDATVSGSPIARSVAWCPSGRRIAFVYARDAFGNPECTAILDPMTDRVRKYPQLDSVPGADLFAGWIDSSTFFEDYNHKIMVRDAETGLARRQLDKGQMDIDSHGFFSINRYYNLVPLQCQAGDGYVTVALCGGWRGVTFLRKSLVAGRRICAEDGDLAYSQAQPRIDPMGEWCAWTTALPQQACPGYRVRVALKRLSDPSSTPPTILGEQLRELRFCDWTEDGNLLVFLADEQDHGLAIIDKNGMLLRKIPAPAGINPLGPPASWRKYGHQ